MQRRNLTAELARGAGRLLALPFLMFRRSARSKGERSQSARRAKFDTSKWNRELLRHLEWGRFEELCTAYFEAMGFTARVTHSRADGSADIALHMGDDAKPAVLARCKAWSAYPIGIKPLLELHAAMAAEGVAEAVLVTSGRFTKEAELYAPKERIQLLDGARLLEQFAGLAPEKSLALLKLATRGDFLTPTCPRCAIRMTSRKSTGDGRAFWGCENYPRCKETFSSATLAP